MPLVIRRSFHANGREAVVPLMQLFRADRRAKASCIFETPSGRLHSGLQQWRRFGRRSRVHEQYFEALIRHPAAERSQMQPADLEASIDLPTERI